MRTAPSWEGAMRQLLGAMIVAGVAATGAWAGSTGDRWIHVRVDDNDGGHGRVDIQVPITMVSGLLPALKGRVQAGGIHVDRKDVDLDELRSYWTAVRDAKDGEYVTVRDEDAHVRIAKRDGHLVVNVDETSGGSRVRLKIPMPLVDAVLAGGDTIDLEALGKAIEKTPSGELLTVDDHDSHVRIWIDTAPAPAREETP
jgi:hypothetical protein